MTYIIETPDAVTAGTYVGSITPVDTMITTAHFRDSSGGYFSVPLGVPLCDHCDAHVPNGHCVDCEEPGFDPAMQAELLRRLDSIAARRAA